MTAVGHGGARAVVHARDGFLGRRYNSNKVIPAPETGSESPGTIGLVPAAVPPAVSILGESPASVRSQSVALSQSVPVSRSVADPSRTVSEGGRSRGVSDGGSMSLVSDFEPDFSPEVHMSDVASKLDKQCEDAERDALRVQAELEQVEAQICSMQLLADPSAPDPVQTLADRGAASAAAAEARGFGIDGFDAGGVPRGASSASKLRPDAHMPHVRARIPSTEYPVEREEFFVQHSAIVDTLQDFQRRMSTLDVAQVPVSHAMNGRQPWSAARSIDEEIERMQHDIQRLLHQSSGWVERQEFLAHVLHQAAELCQERPAHLRRLTGVAKVSLDNRFTRRVVDRLAQLLHEMNIEIITELRRETARDTAAAAAFDAGPDSSRWFRQQPGLEQRGTGLRDVPTLHGGADPPGVAMGGATTNDNRMARAPGDHQ
jgi:hypothetical protein